MTSRGMDANREHGAAQAVLLAMTTVGLPRTAAAWQWTWKQIEHDGEKTTGS